jgi:hypothetical protein
MKPLTRNLIIVASLGLLGIAAYGKKKYDEAVSVLGNLSFSITKISKVSFSLPFVYFDAVIKVDNPTNINFGASLTNQIVVKEVRVYDLKNVYLGKANPNLSNIQLPADTTTELPKMKFIVDITKLFSEITSNIALYLNYDFSALKYEIDVEAFGKIITLEA